mmetsp:Transcript_31202/g.71228  ORF Transcript_31202/g.71228 Transcript_31202/m.71228 type:complete len:129 (-) Transcript_31202:72-458(-)
MEPLAQVSPAEQVIFFTKEASEQNFLFQRVCLERCMEVMLGETSKESSGSAASSDGNLSTAAQRCADSCVTKLFDTSLCVHNEMEAFKAQVVKQQQFERLVGKVAVGAGGLALASGLCCYLFSGGADE